MWLRWFAGGFAAISVVFNFSALCGAATAAGDPITTADKAAFKAVMQLHELVRERQAEEGAAALKFSATTDNPAKILDTRWAHSAICNGITHTGLYLTADAKYVGSPFGLVQLYQSRAATDAEKVAFTEQLKSQLELRELASRIAIGGIGAQDYFSGPISAVTSVRGNAVPSLSCAPRIFELEAKETEIGAARRKWCWLTKQQAGLLAKVAAAVHDERAAQLTERAAVVERWAEQSATSLAKLSAWDAPYTNSYINKAAGDYDQLCGIDG